MGIEILLIVGLVVTALVLLGGRTKPDADFKAPATTAVPDQDLKGYVAAESLFVQPSEYALFCALERAVPGHLRVMAKVRLEDIIKVRRGLPNKTAWSLRGRVKSRHVDFVICTQRGKVLCAIELDGLSHKPGNLADDLKDRLFARVGIPLHRIRVGDKFAPRVARIMADLSPG